MTLLPNRIPSNVSLLLDVDTIPASPFFAPSLSSITFLPIFCLPNTNVSLILLTNDLLSSPHLLVFSVYQAPLQLLAM